MTSRGTTSDRDYGGQHQRLRAYWKPYVDQGLVRCHAVRCLMPSRWIAPGSRWDLGHTADRSGWTGPEHMKCNRSEGATRGNRQRRRRPRPRPVPLVTSRQW